MENERKTKTKLYNENIKGHEKKNTLKCLCLILDTFFECLEREKYLFWRMQCFLFPSHHRICQNENENNPMKIQYLHKTSPAHRHSIPFTYPMNGREQKHCDYITVTRTCSQ